MKTPSSPLSPSEQGERYAAAQSQRRFRTRLAYQRAALRRSRPLVGRGSRRASAPPA